MGPSADRSYIWVFYTSAGLLFAGVVLRALIEIEDKTVLLEALPFLLVWLGLFVSERALSRRWLPWTIVYLVLQTAIIVGLFLLPADDDDFFAVLFAVLSMQALQRFGIRGAAWLAVFAVLMLFAFLFDYSAGKAITLTLTYSAVNVFLGVYALATRRADDARTRNQRLGKDLELANAELRDSLKRLESLAVARERHRVARELHDSVTQTIFSMNLASQSAALLLEREPAKVGDQLARLRELAEEALAEMRLLVSELKPDAVPSGDLSEALRRHVERRQSDGLNVTLEIDERPLLEDAGTHSRALSGAEQAALLRIAQEALNNVVKHAGTTEAQIRLTLGGCPRLEIQDRGLGFDPMRRREGPGMGLAGMSERAAEVGWSLEVESTPGQGTRIVVQRAADRRGEE